VTDFDSRYESGVISDLDVVIEFIPNEEFELLDEEEFLWMDGSMTLYSDRDDRGQVEATEIGDFRCMGALPLLSPTGESFLFRKLNYLRFRAVKLRDAILAGDLPATNEDQLRWFLSEADDVRNHIAECNLRLVLSIVRRFAATETEFDDLASEGLTIMLKAIDKFDFSRGFRFSTYATSSVQRHFYRVSKQKMRRYRMEVGASTERLNQLPMRTGASEEPAARMADVIQIKTLVSRMDECLDDREQRIIQKRFGIGTDGVPKTLRDVASDVDLSKERVRQIQLTAFRKLRKFFGELQSDLLTA